MSNFELWLKACEEFGTIIYPLGKNGDCRLYKTTSEYISNNNVYYTEPVYHVWVGDKCILSIANYIASYRKYEQCIKERSKNGG